MKRRINNLHKGMFKGNKTSNIIELHSRKRQEEKENQNINISQYKYANNKEKVSKNISNNIRQKKNNSPIKNQKVSNIYNDTFSDSDSSHNKSMIKTKLYNKYTKSGTYFKRLRQQVIDKFISGNPLISIERMYNNPEVKKMFGVQNNTEKSNYLSNNYSYKNEEEIIISKKEERDRRIPPSKFIPMQNIFNNMNPQFNDTYNNTFNNINSINNLNDTEEINPNNCSNNFSKINPNYYRPKIQNQKNKNIYQNNNNYNPYLCNQKQKQNNINNMSFMNTNDNNEINSINDNSERDIFEFDELQNMEKEFRRKRISNKENGENYMIQLSGINEEISDEYNNYYKNENKEYNEKEDITNLLNNLKNGNKNYIDYNNFPYGGRENDSYFNNLLIKKDKNNHFINYFKNKPRIMGTTETNNDISFDTPSKK